MALSIQTNYANLVGQNTLNKTNADFNTSLERLSTGFRINSASDDAAGLQISNRLEAQGRGMGVAMRNAGDATSQMQTAEGAMEEMTNIAYRMSDLATQSANGTASDDDRTAMEAEFQSLASELGSLMENTNMGGQKLLDKTDGVFAAGAISYQVGNTSAEKLSVNITAELGKVASLVGDLAGAATFTEAYDTKYAEINTAAYSAAVTTAKGANNATVSGSSGYYSAYYSAESITGAATAQQQADAEAYAVTTADASRSAEAVTAGDTAGDTAANLGTSLDTMIEVAANQEASGLTLTSQTGATNAIDTLSGFITDIGATRSQLGANINRLDHTMANLASMSENTAAAKSRIMDTDMAAESSAMSKNQMLMQAGAQVLSSTKMVPQLAMSLMG
ncbi:flagellin domain protein [Psychromonas ingrahamii 37]|uniref:Flagellin n=1 Tax=Psychromonas ingrahamii (strain DSM 17664 / CCUG 51855 / 37) TaxID=357804 RepID=A1T0K6_PSYIN|nr:flagellin [Psychromonas ingrahamii]ABM05271.1 flagellin domain protein [Psychromonas ingrahamii 37]